MNTYISLLRGINIGGHKSIKMTDLTVLYAALGFTNVSTYIQSGNVVFKSSITNSEELSAMITQKIKTIYNFDVPVHILTNNDLATIILHNPFINNNQLPIETLHVTLLASVPTADKLMAISLINKINDAYTVIGKTIYLHCTNGYGNSKLTNTAIENKLKISATTRNWKTILALHAIAKQYQM